MGNPGQRKLPENEPPELDGMPECPKHVTGEAKAEWNRVCQDLKDMGLMSRAYRPALAAYVDTWAEFVKCKEAYAKMGPVIKTTNGNYVQNPMLGAVNRLKDDLRKWLVEFGLTASSKTRVAMEPVKQDDDIEHYLTIADTG